MAALSGRWMRVTEHNALLYRRMWRSSIAVSLVSPFFFLASMGIGLGSLVQRGSGGVGGASYLDFIAPGLLAAGCMQTAVFEESYPILGRILWQKQYEGMLATPLSVAGIVAGEFGWLLVRLAITATAFFLVAVLFGVGRSPLAVLGIATAVLTGAAFGIPALGYAAVLQRDAGFAGLQRFVIMPLFILSGTFFPIERLPLLIQGVAWALPLSHGIKVTRDLMGGQVGAVDLLHLAVLLAYIAMGWAAAYVLMRRRLVH